MMSTQLDKTMDADDVGHRLSHDDEDELTPMQTSKGKFPKYDENDKQKSQTMTNFKGPERFLMTNMNKTP